MATASTVSLSPSTAGLYHLDNLSEDSAIKASALLQQNHDRYHVYNTDYGFHNHIAHHLLTLYALGSSPELLEQHYRRTSQNQRPRRLPDVAGPEDVGRSNTGRYGTYDETVVYFQKRIDAMGVPAVVQEYLLKGGEEADALLARLYTAHPLIHVVFGIEFDQPAIVAEGLAMAAVDSNPLKLPFIEAERIATSRSKFPGKPMVQLLEEIRTNPAIIAAKEYGQGAKMENLYDGPAYRCEGHLTLYMSRWKVDDEPGALDKKLAELINASARTAAGASVRPGKPQKFDFLQIHSLTSWYATYILTQQPWISDKQKIRLVEYQGRLDMGLYAICGAAEIRFEDLRLTRESSSEDTEEAWEDVLRQSTLINDDGHSTKLIRSLALGKKVSGPYERPESPEFEVTGTDWLRIANMAVESLKTPDKRWVRLAGYDDAWTSFDEPWAGVKEKL